MANILLTSNTRFNPYSLNEMLGVASTYGNAYKDLESQYSDLSSKTGVWENLLNKDIDAESYNKYNQYSQAIQEQADVLGSKGLTPGVRQQLLGLKKRYSEDIIPMENAYNRRQEMLKQQEAMLAKDPSLLIERPASAYSIDELVKNPTISSRSTSGSELEKTAYTAASQLAKAVTTDPRYSNILGGQYFQSKIKQGYTPEQIMAAAQFDESAPPELRNIISSVYASSGIEEWGDSVSKERAMEYIKRGLYGAIGSEKYDTLSNKGWNATPTGPSPMIDAGFKDYDLYITPNQVMNAKVNGLNLVDKNGLLNKSFDNMFDKSGKMKLKADTSSPNPYLPDESQLYEIQTNKASQSRFDSFKETLVSLGIDPNSSKSQIETQLKQLQSGEIPSDAVGHVRNRFNVDSTAGSEIARKVATGLRNGKIQIISGYEKDGKYKVTEAKDISDINDKGLDITSINYNPKNGQISFAALDKDNKSVEALLPSNTLGLDAENFIADLNKQQQEILKILNTNPSVLPEYLNYKGMAVTPSEYVQIMENQKINTIKEVLGVHKVKDVNK